MVALYVITGHICQIKTYQTEPSFVFFLISLQQMVTCSKFTLFYFLYFFALSAKYSVFPP